MPQPPATSASSAKKRKQRMIIIGAAGAALLLLLYLRARSSSSTNATTSSTDAQTAYNQGLQAQAAMDASAGGVTPSTFADNGANASALGDSLTTGLQGINDTLNQLPGAIAAGLPAAGAGAGAAPLSVTINTSPVDGTVGTGTSVAPNTSTTTAPSSGFASANHRYLAPGVSSPNYALTPPRGAPSSARWGGPAKPSGSWRGIGGGWWVPTHR